MQFRKTSIFVAAVALLIGGGALADYSIKDGDGNPRTFRSFLCQTTKHCPGHVTVDSSGNEVLPATSGLQTTLNGKVDIANGNLGAPGDTACASDTASCSHNALLQRIAQRLTSLINVFSSAILVNTESTKATYRIYAAITPAASTTDVFTLKGSATKTVRIRNVRFSGYYGAATVGNVSFIKRSAANTGGTSTSATAVPLDSSNAAATAVGTAYTANPSGLGTVVGTVASAIIVYNTTSATIPADFMNRDFGVRNTQAIVLRGTSEMVAINLGSASPTAAFVEIEWTEE